AAGSATTTAVSDRQLVDTTFTNTQIRCDYPDRISRAATRVPLSVDRRDDHVIVHFGRRFSASQHDHMFAPWSTIGDVSTGLRKRSAPLLLMKLGQLACAHDLPIQPTGSAEIDERALQTVRSLIQHRRAIFAGHSRKALGPA